MLWSPDNNTVVPAAGSLVEPGNDKCRCRHGMANGGLHRHAAGYSRALRMSTKALLFVAVLVQCGVGRASAQTTGAIHVVRGDDSSSAGTSASAAAEAINYLTSIGIRGSYCLEETDPSIASSMKHLVEQLMLPKCSETGGITSAVRSPHRRTMEGPEDSAVSAVAEGCTCGGEEEESHGGRQG